MIVGRTVLTLLTMSKMVVFPDKVRPWLGGLRTHGGEPVIHAQTSGSILSIPNLEFQRDAHPLELHVGP